MGRRLTSKKPHKFNGLQLHLPRMGPSGKAREVWKPDSEPPKPKQRRSKKAPPQPAPPPEPPPPAPTEPQRFGAAVLRTLPDGRIFPRELAAQQFNAKHVALLENRLEEFTEEGVLFLAGRLLTDKERFDLIRLLQETLLPELFGEPLPAKSA